MDGFDHVEIVLAQKQQQRAEEMVEAEPKLEVLCQQGHVS